MNAAVDTEKLICVTSRNAECFVRIDLKVTKARPLALWASSTEALQNLLSWAGLAKNRML